MAPRILLVNPPLYDFTAYDFWLKPYGLLGVGGAVRGRAEMVLFDFLDRLDPRVPRLGRRRADAFGRGEFHAERVEKPAIFSMIPRYYRRYGMPRAVFADFLRSAQPFDVALVATSMTYWYAGVREVIEDIRARSSRTRIVLGGLYATLCPDHAGLLGADLVVRGRDLEPLWQLLGLRGDGSEPPLWEAYGQLASGALKLTRGCPYRCSYCAVPVLDEGFSVVPAAKALAELGLLVRRGCRNVAFYDDALLFEADKALVPFMQEALRRRLAVQFHTPNALHARLLTPELARQMVRAGVETFYLGFESASDVWQGRTGGKVGREELSQAVENLLAAGARAEGITAYLILGHPDHEAQELEASMRFVHVLGVRIMLADFSPVPGTPDGQAAAAWADVAEPLWHNKTAFTIARLGVAEVQRLKGLCRELNERLGG